MIVSQNVGDGVIEPEKVKVVGVKGKTYAYELSGFERIRGMLRGRMPAGVEPFSI
jgi:hypothetical protein